MVEIGRIPYTIKDLAWKIGRKTDIVIGRPDVRFQVFPHRVEVSQDDIVSTHGVDELRVVFERIRMQATHGSYVAKLGRQNHFLW